MIARKGGALRARLAFALVLAVLLVGCGDDAGFFSTLTTATTSLPTTSTTGAPATTATTAAGTTTTSTIPPVGEWAWSLLAADGSAFGGVPPAQGVTALVAGGPGLVAVGAEYTETEGDVAVWTSPDGRAWSRVPHDEAVFGGEGLQYPLGVAAGGPGVVAVGADGSGGGWVLAVWTSSDGLNWERLPLDEAAVGRWESRRAERVMAWSGGLVAVGESTCEEGYCAAVWVSPDGVNWSRVPHDEAVFGGEGTQSMLSVAAGGPSLVAVGLDGPPGQLDGAVWTSPDGVTWSRVADDGVVFGGRGRANRL